MSRKILTFLGALAVVGVVAVACRDDSLTLEEYLREVEATFSAFYADGDRLQDGVSAAAEQAETEEEAVEALRDFWASLNNLYRDAVADVAHLHPPPQAKEAHDEWLAVESEGVDLVDELNARAQRATSVAELLELNDEFEGPVATDLSERAYAACLDLQSIADENDIGADLQCED